MAPKKKMLEDLDATTIKVGTSLARGTCTFAAHNIIKGTRILRDRPLLLFEKLPESLELDRRSRDAMLALEVRPTRVQHNKNLIQTSPEFSVLYEMCHPFELNESSTLKKLRKKVQHQASVEEAAKVLAIFHENRVRLQIKKEANSKDAEEKTVAANLEIPASPECLATKMARINHSCAPNVAVSWNDSLDRYVVHAIEDIEKGEEICYSYVRLPLPCVDRQEQLQQWQIDRDCTACKFNNMDEQQQGEMFLQIAQVTRPGLRRIPTGEFRQLLYKVPGPQASENRRQAWKTHGGENLPVKQANLASIGAPGIIRLMEYLGTEEEDYSETIEERAKMYTILTRLYHDNPNDRDPQKSKDTCEKAMELVKICYGIDSKLYEDLVKFREMKDKTGPGH